MTEETSVPTLEAVTAMNDAIAMAEDKFLAAAESYLKANRGKLKAIQWNWENVVFKGYAQNFFDLTLIMDNGLEFFLGEQQAVDERAELLDQLLAALDIHGEAEDAIITRYEADAEATVLTLLSQLTGIAESEVVGYLHTMFAWLSRNNQRDGRVRMNLDSTVVAVPDLDEVEA